MASKINWKDDFTNPWFLSVIGLIGASLVATIAMIMIAFSASPDLVNKDYYEKGQKYFSAEAKQRKQTAELWRLNLVPPGKPAVGKPQKYRLYVVSPDGTPIREGSAKLFAYRPSNAKDDFEVAMQWTDIGTFLAEVSFPLPGTWDLIGEVQFNGQSFDVAQRIFVKD